MKDENGNGTKTAVMVLGVLIYGGVILVAAVLTVIFVTGWLEAPQNLGDYLVRGALFVGVGLVSLNAVALPLALKSWALEGKHRAAAFVGYAVDMILLFVNLITSFSVLQGSPPAWVEMYEPYSVGLFIIPLATWGVLFTLDPVSQAKLLGMKAKQAYAANVERFRAEYFNSAEGVQAAREEAERLAKEDIDKEKRRRSLNTYAEGNPIPANSQNTLGLYKAETEKLPN